MSSQREKPNLQRRIQPLYPLFRLLPLRFLLLLHLFLLGFIVLLPRSLLGLILLLLSLPLRFIVLHHPFLLRLILLFLQNLLQLQTLELTNRFLIPPVRFDLPLILLDLLCPMLLHPRLL